MVTAAPALTHVALDFTLLRPVASAIAAAVARSLRRRLHPGGRLRIVSNGIDLERVDAEPAPDVARLPH